MTTTASAFKSAFVDLPAPGNLPGEVPEGADVTDTCPGCGEPYANCLCSAEDAPLYELETRVHLAAASQGHALSAFTVRYLPGGAQWHRAHCLMSGCARTAGFIYTPSEDDRPGTFELTGLALDIPCGFTPAPPKIRRPSIIRRLFGLLVAFSPKGA